MRGRVSLSEAVSLYVDLMHNPESSVARELNLGERPWSTADYLLAHLWAAQTGKQHPALPKNIKRVHRLPERQAAVNRALDRKRERERRIASGELT